MQIKQRSYFLILTVLILSVYSINNTYASDLFETGYIEKIYSPIPKSFVKIYNRLKGWTDASLHETRKLKSSTDPRVVRWREAILAIRPINKIDELQQINTITNRAVTYVDDYQHYNKDYWAPPVETLMEGGDCEDIALLKVVALFLRGWDVSQSAHILVGMVNFHGKPTPHAVVEVDAGNNSHFVMRSLNNEVLSFNEMNKDMKPLYLADPRKIVIFNDKGNDVALMFNRSDSAVAPAAGNLTRRGYGKFNE